MKQSAKPLSQRELNQLFAFGVKILIRFFSSNVLQTSREADIESKGNAARKFNTFFIGHPYGLFANIYITVNYKYL